METLLQPIQIDYIQATRCWRSNDYRSCLTICDSASSKLKSLQVYEDVERMEEIVQLKHQLWFLKIKCLADDYFINESLLLNEEDVENEDQVRVFRGKKTGESGGTIRATSIATGDGKKSRIGTGVRETSRHRAGILTGRMSSVTSRHSSRATSSYRPLTTSLNATQTAFSRSTRPLMRYSTCNVLSKPIFEYLFNTQSATNKCPDYRQCLEYLNLVQDSERKASIRDNTGLSSSVRAINKEDLDPFWLISFGICYFKLNMNRQAEEYFCTVIKKDPRLLDSYAWLVKIYLRTGQASKILRVCKDGLSQTRSAILLNWMARVHSIMGNFQAANLNLKESLLFYPTNLEALSNVAHFAFYSDHPETALRCYERIYQLTVNRKTNLNDPTSGSLAELLNNLALCYFYCGYYHKVLPTFHKAFTESPSKEVTSDIWYNISFVTISCGFKNLSISCLRLSLKNNSQNEEAINNLAVFKYGHLIDDQFHFENRQELWNSTQHKQAKVELENINDQKFLESLFDEIEVHFNQQISNKDNGDFYQQPEMLYNMAVVKEKRGQLLESTSYCRLYLRQDPDNYHMKNLLKEIRQLVAHDE